MSYTAKVSQYMMDIPDPIQSSLTKCAEFIGVTTNVLSMRLRSEATGFISIRNDEIKRRNGAEYKSFVNMVIDYLQESENLAHCTQERVASHFSVPVDVFRRILARDKNVTFSELRQNEKRRRFHATMKLYPKITAVKAAKLCGFFTSRGFRAWAKQLIGEPFSIYRDRIQSELKI